MAPGQDYYLIIVPRNSPPGPGATAITYGSTSVLERLGCSWEEAMFGTDITQLGLVRQYRLPRL